MEIERVAGNSIPHTVCRGDVGIGSSGERQAQQQARSCVKQQHCMGGARTGLAGVATGRQHVPLQQASLMRNGLQVVPSTAARSQV